MIRYFYCISIFLLLIVNIGCQEEELADQEIENTDDISCSLGLADTDKLVNGEQGPIVAGKLLSFAVSSEDECAYTPPGKWVNLYGTVYYRYVERGSGDEKLSVNGLVKESAEAVASVLNAGHLESLLTIVPQQLLWENQARGNRDIIARELYKWKAGDGGDENLINMLTNENGRLLKDIIHQRTSIFATIRSELNNEQKEAFCLTRNLDNETIDPDDLKNIKNQLKTEEEKTILNLLLSKFFAWSTGTKEMNQLVDDGRPAVYFGFANLRVEDRSGDDVSNSLRKDASDLIANTLHSVQEDVLNKLIVDQKDYLETYFLTRAQLASYLEKYLVNTSSINTAELLEICVRSEMAESQLGVLQAKEMGEIIESMDSIQLKGLLDFKASN